MRATGLRRPSAFKDRQDVRARAEQTLAVFAGLMRDSPGAAGQTLVALDFHLGPTKEIAVIGSGMAAGQVVRAARSRFLPHVVVAAHDPAAGPASVAIALLK